MDTIKIARELGKAIQQDESFLKLVLAQQANDEDAELQKLIGDFNLKRVDLNTEISKDDKDQDKITSLNDELRELYAKVMGNANMNAYNDAKGKVDELVEFVMQILRGSVNGEDPETIEKQAAGCSGGCDSCSGCH